MFAAETLTLFPEKNGCISLAFRFAIPKVFYGKIFPRSGLFKQHLITCDAGVFDLDFRGIVQVLMMNHHPEKTFTIRTGDRIAQCVFMKKYNVEFLIWVCWVIQNVGQIDLVQLEVLVLLQKF